MISNLQLLNTGGSGCLGAPTRDFLLVVVTQQRKHTYYEERREEHRRKSSSNYSWGPVSYSFTVMFRPFVCMSLSASFGGILASPARGGGGGGGWNDPLAVRGCSSSRSSLAFLAAALAWSVLAPRLTPSQLVSCSPLGSPLLTCSPTLSI